MKSGVLCLRKEAGMTSHDAVARIRRLYGTKKVGHTGTLDPQATGVLPILIGSAVKACDLIPGEKKVYRATLRFGVDTDTEDIWGKVREESPLRPDRDAFARAVADFVGPYAQIPPMVSAVKIGGKKLYEYARAGLEIPRPARLVTIYDLKILSLEEDEATLLASVSKGTYIRTLLVDLCRRVGCLGTMSALEREQSGKFDLSQALTLSQLEEMTPAERENALFPTEKLFEDLPAFAMPPFFDRLIENGLRVRCAKLGLEKAPVGQRFRLLAGGVFTGLGEVAEEDGETVLFRKKAFFPDREKTVIE